MTQALRKLITFDEFVAQYPDNPQRRYELHDGVIVEMAQPTGDHEEVTGFLATKITLEYSRLNLPYFIPKTVFVKPLENESAYSPDVLILNQPNLINEPLWKKTSTVSLAASIPLVVEVVSTNWRDDYHKNMLTMKKWEFLNTGLWTMRHWVVGNLLANQNNLLSWFAVWKKVSI